MFAYAQIQSSQSSRSTRYLSNRTATCVSTRVPEVPPCNGAPVSSSQRSLKNQRVCNCPGNSGICTLSCPTLSGNSHRNNSCDLCMRRATDTIATDTIQRRVHGNQATFGSHPTNTSDACQSASQTGKHCSTPAKAEEVLFSTPVHQRAWVQPLFVPRETPLPSVPSGGTPRVVETQTG